MTVGHFKMPRTGMGIAELDKVIADVSAEINELETRTMSGLIRATVHLRRSMDKVAPKIPVDTGNLRQSWFVVTSRGGTPRGASPTFKEERKVKTKKGKVSRPVDVERLERGHMEALAMARSKLEETGIDQEAVAFGFGAYYAAPVHELHGAEFKRKGAGPKFFQAALKREAMKMLEIVAKEAQMKGVGYARGGTGRAVRGKIKQEFD